MGMLVNIDGYGQINFEDADSLEEVQNFVDTDPAFKTQLTEQGFGSLFERPDPGIGGDIARGTDQLHAMFYGAGAAVGDIVGSEDLVDWGIQGYERNMAEASKNAAAIGTYKNINDIGDAGRYAVEAIFENLPMFLPSLVTGGVGAFVGRKVAERAVKSVTADIISKKMAQGWSKESAERLAQTAGGKMILDNVKAQGAKQAATQVAGRNLVNKGAMAGAYAGALPMTTGEVTGSVYEATGEVHGGLGLAGGAISATFEMLPNFMFLKNVLGKDVASGLTNSLIKRVGIGTAKGMLAEGPTEFAQTIVEHVATNIADPTIDIFSPEHNDELIDSFLKGSIAGGGIGGTSTFVGGMLNREGGPDATEITIDGTLVDSATLARDEPDSGRKIKHGELDGIYAGSFTDSNDKTTKVGLFNKKLLPIFGDFEFLVEDETAASDAAGTVTSELSALEKEMQTKANADWVAHKKPEIFTKPIDEIIAIISENLGEEAASIYRTEYTRLTKQAVQERKDASTKKHWEEKSKDNLANWLKSRGIRHTGSKHDLVKRVIEEVELEREHGEDVRTNLLNDPNYYMPLKELYAMSADEVRAHLAKPKGRAPEPFPDPTPAQLEEVETLKNDIFRNASREENEEGDLVYTFKRDSDVKALIDYLRDNIYTRSQTLTKTKKVENPETGKEEPVDYEVVESIADPDAAREHAFRILSTMDIQPKPVKPRKNFDTTFAKNDDRHVDLSEMYNIEHEFSKGLNREYRTATTIASLSEAAQTRIAKNRKRLNELRRKFKLSPVKDWVGAKHSSAKGIFRRYTPDGGLWIHDPTLDELEQAPTDESQSNWGPLEQFAEYKQRMEQDPEGLQSPTPQGKMAVAPQLFANEERNPLAPYEAYITEGGVRVAVINTVVQTNGNIHVNNLRALRPGGGTIAMRRLIEEADNRGVSISLQALPFFPNPGVQEFTVEDLKEWYGKFGFVFTDASSEWGARAPRQKTRHAIGRQAFFSKLGLEVDKLNVPSTKAMKSVFWINKITHMVKNLGVKPAEIEFLGILDWLREGGTEKVSKDTIQAYLAEHSLLSTMKLASPEYSEYTLGTGGENYQVLTVEVPGVSLNARRSAQKVYEKLPSYQEMLESLLQNTNLVDRSTTHSYVLKTAQDIIEESFSDPSQRHMLRAYLTDILYRTSPNLSVDEHYEIAEASINEVHRDMDQAVERDSGFREGHFKGLDELIHVRVEERTNERGEKVLVILEIQSDWHGLWNTSRQDLEALTDKLADLELEILWINKYPMLRIDGMEHLELDPASLKDLQNEAADFEDRIRLASIKRFNVNSKIKRNAQNRVAETYESIAQYQAAELIADMAKLYPKRPALKSAILYINDNLENLKRNNENADRVIEIIQEWDANKSTLVVARLTEAEAKDLADKESVIKELSKQVDKVERAQTTAARINLKQPPINDWYSLGLKMAIHHAAARGIHRITWPTTEKQISKIEQWEESQAAGPRILSMFNDHLPRKAKKFIKKFGGKMERVGVVIDQRSEDDLSELWYGPYHEIVLDDSISGILADVDHPIISKDRDSGDDDYYSVYAGTPTPSDSYYMASFSTLAEAKQFVIDSVFGSVADLGISLSVQEKRVLQNANWNIAHADKITDKIVETLNQFTITTELMDVAKGEGFALWSRPMAWHGKATQQFQEQAPEVQTKLRALLDQMGLPDISLKVVKAIGDGKYRGRYHERLIEIALNYENPETTLKHEAIHALINLGLFTDQELAILNKAAKRWVNELGIREQYADVRNEYGKPLTEEELMEEAIAYKMERFNTEKAEVRTLLKRIADFIKALGETLGIYKFTTPEDIFGRVIRGEVGGRARWNHPIGGELMQPSEALMRTANNKTYNRAKYAMGSMSGGKETVTTDMFAFAKFTTDNRNQSIWDRDFARMWLPLDYIRRDFNILLDKAIHKLRAMGRIKGNPAVWPEFIKATEIAAMSEGHNKRLPERWMQEGWDGDRTIQDGDEIVFINGETPGIAKNSKLQANEVIILKGAAAQAWVNMQDANNDVLKSFKDAIIYHDRDNVQNLMRMIKFQNIDDPQYILTWPEAQNINRQDFVAVREYLEAQVYGYEQDVKQNILVIQQLKEIVQMRKDNKQDSTEEQELLDEAKEIYAGLKVKKADFKQYYDGIKLAERYIEDLGMYEAMIDRDYVPMGRFGSHFIAVYAPEDMVNGERKAGAKPKYVEFYEPNPAEKASDYLLKKNGDARRAVIQAKFPDDHVSNMGSVSKDQLQKSLAGIGNQVDLLWSTMNASDREVHKKLFNDFANLLDNGKGTFFNNMKQRQKIPGFEIEDVHRSIGQYILAGAHISTRLKHKKDSDAGLNKFTANNQGAIGKKRRDHAIQTHNFILGPEEGYQKMKQLGFVWYLGGNISTGLLQMMSMPQFAMWHLTKFTGGKKIGKVAAAMARATKDVMKGFVWGPQKVYDDIPFDPNKMNVNPKELKFILRTMAESITKQGSFLEESGISVNEAAFGTRAKATEAWRSFMVKYMAAPFSTFETLSRTATALAAYRLAQDPKLRARADFVMKDDNLWQQELEDRGLTEADEFHIAKYVVNESFGQFGKENKPQMYRNGSGAIFQFTYYPMAMFQGLGRMFLMQGAEGRKAFAGVMLMLLITAGMRGLPGADDSEKIIRFMLKNVTGLDADMSLILRQMLQDVEGGVYMADFIENGLFNAMGLNIQSRVSMGQIPGIDIPLSLLGIQGNNADVLGLAGSYITSAQKGIQLIGEERSAEAMAIMFPAFIRNGIKGAIVYPTEGVRTISGTQLLTPDDIKWYHQAWQIIGFTPTAVSNARNREFVVSKLNEVTQGRKRGYERRLEKYRYNNIKAAIDKDHGALLEAQKEFAAIVKEIIEYNLTASSEDKIIPNLNNINKRVLGRLYPDLSRMGQVDKNHRGIAYKLYKEGSAYER